MLQSDLPVTIGFHNVWKWCLKRMQLKGGGAVHQGSLGCHLLWAGAAHTLLLQYFLKKWWCVVLRDEVTHKVALQACKSQINYYPNHSTTQIWSKAKIQPIIYLFTISHYFTLQTSRSFYRLRYLRTFWSLIQDANVFAVIWNDTNLTVQQDRVETSHDAP